MAYKANCQEAGPVQVPIRAKVRNLAGMTESQNPNAADPFSSALANINHTAYQTLPSIIDPRLLSMSNTDFDYPGRNAASNSADQSTSTLQSSCTYETFQRMDAHCQRPFRETRSRTRNPPSRSSSRSVGSESQNYKPSTRHRQRRRSNSDASKQAASLQSPSPIKQQPNRRPRRSKAAYSAAAVETRELSTSAEPEDDSASVVDLDNNIRWRDGSMEWHDDQDFRWKPARYHRDCRAELIADAAQQPGAPIWTPDMGVDYTSFSPVTQGWNSNPSSVVNSQGRQVFSIITPPENWQVIPPYGPLVHRGSVLLDHKNKPVRDIPGLPFTLSTEVKGWFLGGLRRCIQVHVKDFTARLPATRVLKNNRTKKSQRDTSLTQRISRFLEKNEIPEWFQRRRKTSETKGPSTTEPEIPSRKMTGKRTQRRASPEVESSDMETDVVNSELYLSNSEHIFPPSWDTTPFMDFHGHPGILYPPIPEPYPYEFEYPAPPSDTYSEGPYQSTHRVAGGSQYEPDTLPYEPYYYPDIPVPSGGESESLPPAIDPSFLDDYHGNIDAQHDCFFNNGGEFPFPFNDQPHSSEWN